MGKTFNSEFRNMIVHLHIDNGKTIKQIADEYGVSVSTIGRWVIYCRNKKQLETEKLSKGVPFDKHEIYKEA